MILLDYSNVSIAAIMAMINTGNFRVDEDIVKHCILNSIRSYNVMFRGEYGKMFIICDNPGVRCWRYQYFPEYKARRKLNRKLDTKVNWDMIFAAMDSVRDAMIEYFPFPVIMVPRCEADDVIGHTAYNAKEKIMIVGNDKDYFQTHSELVSQYRPIQKAVVCHKDDAHIRLKELILCGDDDDDIPNFRSDDKVFITPGARQRPIYEKKMVEWLKDDTNSFLVEEVVKKGKKDKVTKIKSPDITIDLKANFERNRRLIDFHFIPEELQSMIENAMVEYEVHGNRGTVLKYLGANRMQVLMNSMNDFF